MLLFAYFFVELQACPHSVNRVPTKGPERPDIWNSGLSNVLSIHL